MVRTRGALGRGFGDDATMPALRLILGNKNYSSWSMRPWVALREAGIPFDEETIWLDEDQDRAKRRAIHPAGTVPMLRVGEGPETFVVADTLAICETVAELFPDAPIWPSDPGQRARARSLACEMHSGFLGLRTQMPMSCKRQRRLGVPYSERLTRDVARATQIFESARGSFLCGEFGAADAFFAPVASRLRSYGHELQGVAREYSQRLLEVPSVIEWHELGRAETRAFESYDAIP